MGDRPAPVNCPCGHSFEVPGDLAGNEVVCPACRRPFTPAPRLSVDPDLVPGYRILSRLGSGGMGEVYLARQGSLDRMVAIKLLPPVLGQDREFVERFLKEARSAGKLGHENIVTAVDAGEARGRYFFVMEHVKGDTLYRTVKREGKIPEARALDIARQIARGLRHATQHGLIHRDIKPKNVIVTAEGVVKILDFGLARELAADASEEEGEVFSSPAYASPEQCRREPALDHRSDMYSLGVTLFEMLTGRRPFQGTNARQLMDRHMGEDPPSPMALNPAVTVPAAQLVLRLLKKKPEERFRDYDELIAAIEAAGKLPAARPTVRSGREGPAPGALRKNMLPWIAAAAGLALAMTVVIVTLATRGKSRPAAPAAEAPEAAAPASDPEVDRLLEDVHRYQERAGDNPLEVSAIRAKWKVLMERYRGTAHQAVFAARLLEFENRVRADAEKAARGLMDQAEEEIANGKPLEALKILGRLPPPYSGTEAAARVTAKALEIERLVDDRFRDTLKSGERLISGERFEEARGFLKALRESVSEPGYPRPRHREAVESILKTLGEAEAAATARKPKPKPEPAPPVPEPGPVPAPAPAPSGPTHFIVLRGASERADPARRAAAAAVFAEGWARSSFHRAAAVFLSRDDKEWKLGPLGTKELEDYLLTPALGAPETMPAAAHLKALKHLARAMAAAGEEPVDAFRLFACAHADEFLARGGKADPALMKELRLEPAANVELWGVPEGIARVEMAAILQRPATSLGVLRAVEAAANSQDPVLRFLAALCAFKGPQFDVSTAADRWRKAAPGAGDPALARVCDAVADRVKAAGTCESCAGLGRHPCGACSGSASAPCVPCQGMGYTVDDEGVKTACAPCKGKAFVACAACGGSRAAKCATCDGKRTRTSAPAVPFRHLADLGLCAKCSGTGSVFPRAAYPCAVCAGGGRVPDRVAKDFARLPVWLKTREGRLLFAALRWLARHEDGKGAWAPSPCRVCDPTPVGGVHDVGATSLALLAFLGAGFEPGSDALVGPQVQAGEVVRRTISALLSWQQPDGHVVHGASAKPMFEHLLALQALCAASGAIGPGEAFDEKERAALKEAAARALRFALANQNRSAGWGYPVSPPGTDTWVSSWGASALLAAREAGFEVPRANLTWILQWIDSVTDRNDQHIGYTPSQMGKVSLTGVTQYYPHETLSASGSFVRMLVEGKTGPAALAADRFVIRDVPNADPLRRDYCWWHWGTVYLAHRHQRKGADWSQWTAALGRELAAEQDSRDLCSAGSWPPNDRWSTAGGRTYAAAMNALTLAYAAGIRPLVKSSR